MWDYNYSANLIFDITLEIAAIITISSAAVCYVLQGMEVSSETVRSPMAVRAVSQGLAMSVGSPTRKESGAAKNLDWAKRRRRGAPARPIVTAFMHSSCESELCRDCGRAEVLPAPTLQVKLRLTSTVPDWTTW
jgi:hypothetical protein